MSASFSKQHLSKHCALGALAEASHEMHANDTSSNHSQTTLSTCCIAEKSRELVSVDVAKEAITKVLQVIQDIDTPPCGPRCRRQRIASEAGIVCAMQNNLAGQESRVLLQKAEKICEEYNCDCDIRGVQMMRQVQLIVPGICMKNGNKKSMCGPELEEVFEGKKSTTAYSPASISVENIFNESWDIAAKKLDSPDLLPWKILPSECMMKHKVLSVNGYAPTVKENLGSDQAILRNMAVDHNNVSVLYRKFVIGKQSNEKEIFIWAVVFRQTEETTRPTYVRGFYYDYDVTDPMARSIMLPCTSSAPSWWGDQQVLSANKKNLVANPVSGVYTIYHLLMIMLYLHTRCLPGFDAIQFLEHKDILPSCILIPRHEDTVQICNRKIDRDQLKNLAKPAQMRVKRKSVSASITPKAKRLQTTLTADNDHEARRQIEHKENSEKYTNLWCHILDNVRLILSDKSMEAVMVRWKLQQQVRLLNFIEEFPEQTPADTDAKSLRRSIERLEKTHVIPLFRMMQTDIRIDGPSVTSTRGKRKQKATLADFIAIDKPYLYDISEETRHPVMRVFDETSYNLKLCIQDRVKTARNMIAEFK